jgi:hypothetical protein
MIEVVKWVPDTLPDSYRGVDLALLSFHGAGAENLLWLGVSGQGLERRLSDRARTYATHGSSILSKTGVFSPSSYALDWGKEGVVIGLDASLLTDDIFYRDKHEYGVIDESQSLIDSLRAAYALPDIPKGFVIGWWD